MPMATPESLSPGSEPTESSINSNSPQAKNARGREPGNNLGYSRNQSSNSPSTGYIAGHKYVDLGLPSGLKWADCNVGAYEPSDFGNYYAWGEVFTKPTYTQENSQTYDKSANRLRNAGIIDNRGILTPDHDAAHVNWGDTWRMPTARECQELVDNCKWTWTTQDGTKGYLITGPSYNSIFLPLAGHRSGDSLSSTGEYGRCWTSTCNEEKLQNAHCLGFFHNNNSGYKVFNDMFRNFGYNVRPVSE